MHRPGYSGACGASYSITSPYHSSGCPSPFIRGAWGLGFTFVRSPKSLVGHWLQWISPRLMRFGVVSKACDIFNHLLLLRRNQAWRGRDFDHIRAVICVTSMTVHPARLSSEARLQSLTHPCQQVLCEHWFALGFATMQDSGMGLAVREQPATDASVSRSVCYLSGSAGLAKCLTSARSPAWQLPFRNAQASCIQVQSSGAKTTERPASVRLGSPMCTAPMRHSFPHTHTMHDERALGLSGAGDANFSVPRSSVLALHRLDRLRAGEVFQKKPQPCRDVIVE